VDRFGAEQRQHDWSNPEDDNQLAGAAPNNGELNSLSKFNGRQARLESVTCRGEQLNSDIDASSPNFHNYTAGLHQCRFLGSGTFLPHSVEQPTTPEN